VDGGLYYWRIQSGPEGIMRFDFGAAGGVPEMIIQEGTPAGIATCPGCHALSRDGTKMVGSIGGQNDGRLVFMNDMSKSNADPTFLTVSPTSTEGGNNRIQFASFNPTGSEFVAVYGDYGTNNTCIPGDATYGPNCNLFFHNGTTGLRDPAKTKALAFKPDHPDWSPNGNFIAVTRVRGPANSGNTTQMPKETSLELLTKNPDGTFADPVTLVERDNTSAQYKVRYNPNFVPDSSFLLFNESTCPGQNFDNDACDGDSNPTAKVWAVKPQANADPALRATPVFLANSAALGVEDVRVARAHTGDTFPRSAPFQTAHRGGKLFWFTVASRRSVGLRATAGTQHLWMFAVDPAKVLAGQDGSYTGFYLPFQDLQTSNHIAQWTEKVVGGSQPPPAPVPPPPPPPPPPPAGGIREASRRGSGREKANTFHLRCASGSQNVNVFHGRCDRDPAVGSARIPRAPRARDGLHDRDPRERVRMRAQEADRAEERERASSSARALDAGEVVEQRHAAVVGPLVARTTPSPGGERVLAARGVGVRLRHLIEDGNDGEDSSELRRIRARAHRLAVRAAGVTEVVVRELVTEGERDRVVENLART
jgi:hypothetical protein